MSGGLKMPGMLRENEGSEASISFASKQSYEMAWYLRETLLVSARAGNRSRRSQIAREKAENSPQNLLIVPAGGLRQQSGASLFGVKSSARQRLLTRQYA